MNGCYRTSFTLVAIEHRKTNNFEDLLNHARTKKGIAFFSTHLTNSSVYEFQSNLILKFFSLKTYKIDEMICNLILCETNQFHTLTNILIQFVSTVTQL